MQASMNHSRLAALIQAHDNPHSPFYRTWYKQIAYVLPSEDSDQAWAQVPLLTKERLIATPFKERLFLPLEHVTSVRVTSGTSGKGILLFPRTGHVQRPWLRERAQRIMSHYYPYSGMDKSVRQHGVQHLGFDLKHPEASAALAQQYRPDCLTGPATALIAFAPYLGKYYDVRHIHYLHFFGSRTSPSQFEELHTRYPQARISWDYASTEGNGISALPCDTLEQEERNGIHPQPTHYMEIIDIDSLLPITDPYIPGELVLTTLFEHNPLPIMRYRTGDMAQWVPHHCSCPPTVPTIELLGRTLFDRVFLKRGLLLGGELERTLHVFAPHIYDDFELHVHSTREGDSLVLYVREKDALNLHDIETHLAKTFQVSETHTLQDLLEEGLIASVACVSMPSEKVLGRRVTRIVDHRH
jgi:phenylacetate-coenzyme A ligase PaaK-like adenylate-forming protein